MPVESIMLSNHLILCCPLLLLPSIFPRIRVFSNELALHIRWPKYWSISFSISPFNEYSGFISFRNDWFDLLQSKGLSRFFSSTTIQKHQFFDTQPSLWSSSYILTWLLEKLPLTIWTFVSKVMSLLSNTLSRFVIAFLPRSKRLLVSWLLSLSTVILRPKRIKSIIVSTFFLSICHEVMGQDVMILVFLMFSFKPVFSLFSFIRRLFSSSLSAIRVVVICVSEIADISPDNLIPSCNSSSPAFHVMYSA